MDDGLAMRGCGRLGTPHRKALSDRAAVYYNSRVRSWGLGRLQEMLRIWALGFGSMEHRLACFICAASIQLTHNAECR